MNYRIKSLVVAAIAAAPLAGQSDADTHSAASKNFFLLNAESGIGGRTVSSTHVLDASGGSGLVAAPAASANYRLAAGYFGSVATPGNGKPWLAGVLPRFVTMRAAANVTLHGTELDLGGRPTVKIGGQTATLVGAASGDQATVALPIQPAPGWQPVSLVTPAGTTQLPRGIGVLPMIYTDPAAASDKGFEVVFKGTRGDRIAWALGLAPLPAPVKLGGIWHGLLLNPIVTLPGLSILDANGELRLAFPPSMIPSDLYLQAMFQTSNPGYAPAAFSNLLIVHP